MAGIAAANPEVASAMTTTTFDILRAGTGFMALATIFAFISFVVCLVSCCCGYGSCASTLNVVLFVLAFVTSLIGAAASGGGVTQAKWPSLGAPYQYGWGMGCGGASVCTAFIGMLIVSIANCKR